MLSPTSPTPDHTLSIAERQLATLGELAEMALEVCRASAAASVAASRAVVAVVSDTAWQCERDRALAMAGSKSSADAFAKVSRALRLTLRLETTVAEWVRDARSGVWSGGGARGDLAGASAMPGVMPADGDRPCPPESLSRERDTDAEFARLEFERLADVERGDRMPGGSFTAVVDCIRGELGIIPPPLAEEGDRSPGEGWRRRQPPECSPRQTRSPHDPGYPARQSASPEHPDSPSMDPGGGPLPDRSLPRTLARETVQVDPGGGTEHDLNDAKLAAFEPALAARLMKTASAAVLVRPDRYVFGAGEPASLVEACVGALLS